MRAAKRGRLADLERTRTSQQVRANTSAMACVVSSGSSEFGAGSTLEDVKHVWNFLALSRHNFLPSCRPSVSMAVVAPSRPQRRMAEVVSRRA